MIFVIIGILMVLMFDLGLALHFSDFLEVVRRPKAMLSGLFGQIVVLPLIAFAVGSLLDLPPVMMIGLVLIACCPGGASSNAFSKIANGDVALSVSLTALATVITLFTLPAIMHWTTSRLGDAVGVTMPVGNMLKQNFLTSILPVIVGILVRKYFEETALKIDRVLSKVAFPALMFIALAFFVQNREAIVGNFAAVGFSVTGLIVVSMSVAALIGVVMRLGRMQSRTIVIEVGMQNAAQAITLAASPFVFDNPAMAIPAIVYSLMMNVFVPLYVLFVRNR